MKIKNLKDVETFLNVVNECKGDVTLTSQYGDKFNLKSALTQYGLFRNERNEQLFIN